MVLLGRKSAGVFVRFALCVQSPCEARAAAAKRGCRARALRKGEWQIPEMNRFTVDNRHQVGAPGSSL